MNISLLPLNLSPLLSPTAPAPAPQLLPLPHSCCPCLTAAAPAPQSLRLWEGEAAVAQGGGLWHRGGECGTTKLPTNLLKDFLL